MPSVTPRFGDESARRQADWQVSQKASLDAEILQAGKEREQTAATLQASANDTTRAQDSLRTITSALAALALDEYQDQVKFWSTASAVAERALSDVRSRLVERKMLSDQIAGPTECPGKSPVRI